VPTPRLGDPALINPSATRLSDAWVEAEKADLFLRLLEAFHDAIAATMASATTMSTLGIDISTLTSSLTPNGQIALDDLEVLAELVKLGADAARWQAIHPQARSSEKPYPAAGPAQIGVRARGIGWLCRICWMIFFQRPLPGDSNCFFVFRTDFNGSPAQELGGEV
jgi:hypothetical protein